MLVEYNEGYKRGENLSYVIVMGLSGFEGKGGDVTDRNHDTRGSHDIQTMEAMQEMEIDDKGVS